MIDGMPRSMSAVAHLLLPVDYQPPLETKASITIDPRVQSYWLRYVLWKRLNDVVPKTTFLSASQEENDVTCEMQPLSDRSQRKASNLEITTKISARRRNSPPPFPIRDMTTAR